MVLYPSDVFALSRTMSLYRMQCCRSFASTSASLFAKSKKKSAATAVKTDVESPVVEEQPSIASVETTPVVTTNTTRIIRSFAPTDESVVFVKLTDHDRGDGSGAPLLLKSGRLARIANGCAVAQMGDTSVMAVAVMGDPPIGFPDSLNLAVEYRQKAAAYGRIPQNFLRRELSLSDHEVLTGRIIDRSVRGVFPPGYFYQTEVLCQTLAVDLLHDPDVQAVNAASAALAISDIPFACPVGAVRMGFIPGIGPVINPTRRQLADSRLNMVIAAATDGKTVMLDVDADNLPLSDVEECLTVGLQATQSIVKGILELQQKCGKEKQKDLTYLTIPDVIVDTTVELATDRCHAILTDFTHDKGSRDKAVQALNKQVLAELKEKLPEYAEDAQLLRVALIKAMKLILRKLIFDTGFRVDGRCVTDVRPISCFVDQFKPLHGSALFQRGQTQVLCTVTFDSPESAFRSDAVSSLLGVVPREKNFMLHYEFPQYSTGNMTLTSKKGARREIGHGALAEKGLRPVVPKDFPFTIRLTSEVLESNGSSSMATVCGCSLALMDAGVPISHPAAGVAVGLMTLPEGGPENDAIWSKDNYRVLTDISGFEDFIGDMDFKIAGTRAGLTSIQMDLKIPGIPKHVMFEGISAACDAHGRILDIMDDCISKPRSEKKENHPVVEKLVIPAQKRMKLFGVGALKVKQLQSELGVQLTQLDDITYSLFAPNPGAFAEAKECIEKFLEDEPEPVLEYGAIYTAKIVELRDNGVTIMLYPSMTPQLLHLSQLSARPVSHPSALDLVAGQDIQVKYFGRDPITGAHRISRKVLMTEAPVGRNFMRPPPPTKVEPRPENYVKGLTPEDYQEQKAPDKNSMQAGASKGSSSGASWF